ncbi:MAG: hypothetical protein M1379_11045 [Firmicutes bacterium]|nr:hypothetical protein [Bacillota bacterium]
MRTRGAGLKHIAALAVASSVLLALMGTVVGLAVAGMLGSAWISARRLSRLKVVEALREI